MDSAGVFRICPQLVPPLLTGWNIGRPLWTTAMQPVVNPAAGAQAVARDLGGRTTAQPAQPEGVRP